MKAIMISIKPKYCELIMNGEKTIEVRKNKALANAIQKLIDENGYADVYVYCTKTNKHHWYLQERYDHSSDETLGYSTPYYTYIKVADIMTQQLDGKVLFKFRCYNVEEIKFTENEWHGTKEMPALKVLDKSCLTYQEITNYLNGTGFAIHISDLEIFDKPKELSEFRHITHFRRYGSFRVDIEEQIVPLTKAPQNYCYVEVH